MPWIRHRATPTRPLGTIPKTLRPVLSVAFLIVAFLAALTTPAGAAKYAAEFLKLGIGARALGMGSGFVALANDASAAYWNPAGLATLSKPEMLFMHSEQLGSLANHDYLGFVEPLSGEGTRSAVGIGLIRLSVDNILVTKDAYSDLNHNGSWDPGNRSFRSCSRPTATRSTVCSSPTRARFRTASPWEATRS